MNLILQAFSNFQKRFPSIDKIEDIKDGRGLYALKIFNKKTGRSSYFSAKGSMDGDIMSVHLSLFMEARKKQLPITLALGTEKIYVFMPENILKFNYLNERNGVLMINFRIKQGLSWQPEAVKERVIEKTEDTLFTQPAVHPVIQAMADHLGATPVQSAS